MKVTKLSTVGPPMTLSGPTSRRSLVESDVGPARPGLLREVNARRILRLLRLHGPCSQADLARLSGLSSPTMSFAVADLLLKGLIEKAGVGPARSNGGRPPRILRFNAEFGYVAGADIEPSEVRVALANLNGTLLGRWVRSTSPDSTPRRIAALIASGIRELMVQHAVPPQKLLTLAAGVPGIVDARKGMASSLPQFSTAWNSVPLRQILEATTKTATVIENNVNLAAIGESWVGVARGVRDFVFVTVGEGVGAGIFINGALYRGPGWASGEIGYLYLPGTRKNPLVARRSGPFEETVCTAGVERSWQKLLDRAPNSQALPARHAMAAEILGFAEKGDPQARRLLKQISQRLAYAVANVSVVLDCSLVVFGGYIGSNPLLFEAVRQTLERNDFPRPRLAVSVVGTDATLLGAISLALTAAERVIVLSSVSGSFSQREGSGVLQPFLDIAPAEQSKKSS